MTMQKKIGVFENDDDSHKLFDSINTNKAVKYFVIG